MSTLIIGGNSRLSRRIKEKYKIKYTTSRNRNLRDEILFLDLNDTSNFQIPSDVRNCIIVGGPVSYNQSNTSYKSVKRIHEKEIPQLANKLLIRDIFTIYISSNMVLGKDLKDRSESSNPRPNIEYGKMKYICEQEITKRANSINKNNKLAIFRMTKNICPETSPFNNWIIDYGNNKEIYAFSDLYFSPIFYKKAAEAIIKLIELKPSGIFHYSGEKDINYYDFCCELNKILIKKNKKPFKVIATTSIEKGIKLENIGNKTKLDMKSTSNILGIKPLKIESVCDYFVDFLNYDF